MTGGDRLTDAQLTDAQLTDAQRMVDDLGRQAADEQTDTNRLVPRIAAGTAPRATLAALGAEEQLIVTSDRRSFLTLAARATEPYAVEFFASLGRGENTALELLPAFTDAAGMSPDQVDAYEPRAGCQAYPSYLAWLALNGEPSAVLLAIMVNFAAWGDYCATVARGLREHYGFDDVACGFFDFFATPVPELHRTALLAIDAVSPWPGAAEARPGGRLTVARRYARLLQSYEMSFWNTLADPVGS